MILSLLPIVAICLTLAYSGASKLGFDEKVRIAAGDLGLGPRVAAWAGRWLALLELAIALSLIFDVTVFAGALAASILLGAFTALIASNLRQGKHPSCACFGEASAEAISGWTLVRNVSLTALAIAASVATSDGEGLLQRLSRAFESLPPSTGLSVLLLCQIALFIAIRAGLSSKNARGASEPAASRPSAAEPEIGWPAGVLGPTFELPTMDGGRRSLADLLTPGRHLLLLFVSPGCRHCLAMLPEVERWRTGPSNLSLAVLSVGSVQVNRDKFSDFEVGEVLLQGAGEVAEAYRAHATPAAVVVGPDRRIASRVAMGADSVRRLFEGLRARTAETPPEEVQSVPPPRDAFRLTIGDPAPPFALPALRGGQVSLEEFAGRLLVVLYWSPTCGYCARFAPELRIREAEQTSDLAPLLFVSSGSTEANEALGFLSPVVLDDGSLMRAAGAAGTPSALLVDAQGRVASSLASGAEEIRRLLARADLLARSAQMPRT